MLIEYGSSSKDVGALQKKLNSLGFKLKVTETFDDATLKDANALAVLGGYTASVKNIDDSYMRMLSRVEKNKFFEIPTKDGALILEQADLIKYKEEIGPQFKAALRPAVVA